MKAVSYTRVSSKEQEEKGYSLNAQKKLLTQYAHRNKIEIVKTFSVSESASGRKVRQTFDRMLNYCDKKKIPVILCEKSDRLLRSISDSSRMRSWVKNDPKREIHLVKEGAIISSSSKSHETFMFNIKSSVSQFYIDNLSEEVKKGFKEKAEQGWYPSRPPVGYKSIDVNKKKRPVIDNRKSYYIRKIYDLYATGRYSLKQISDMLYEEGFRSVRGNKVYKSKIEFILKNPFYYGDFRWKGSIFEGKHDPLISKELFDRVQKMFKKKAPPKYNKHRYLFQGLFKCAECGGTISWDKKKGYVYGRCNHHKPCSQSKCARQDRIEKQIQIALNSLEISNKRLQGWIVKALKEHHKEEVEYHENQVQQLQKNIDRADNKLNRLYDLLIDNKIPESVYDTKITQIKEEKHDLIKSLESKAKNIDKYHDIGYKLFKLAQNGTHAYEKASREQKGILLNLVFSDLEVEDGTMQYQYTKAFEILNKVAKYTNSSKIKKSGKRSIEIFEPSENAYLTYENGDKFTQSSIWRGGRGSNPRPSQ